MTAVFDGVWTKMIEETPSRSRGAGGRWTIRVLQWGNTMVTGF